MLHPLLATLPIGSWLASLVFDVGSRFVAEPGFLTRGSTWLVAIGLVGAVVAGVFGMVDAAPVSTGTPAHRAVMIHLGLVMSVLTLYAIGLVFRTAAAADRPVGLPLLALSAASVLVVVATAFAGRAVFPRPGASRARPAVAARSVVARSRPSQAKVERGGADEPPR